MIERPPAGMPEAFLVSNCQEALYQLIKEND